MSARASRGAVVMTVSAFLFVGVGCVDEDPIVTGHRPDAGSTSGDAGSPISTVIPGDDGPDEDPPDCRHCGETLSTDTARGTLCRHNSVNGGPSSVRLLNALVDCVCFDKCISKCTSYCSGSKNNLTCSSCFTGSCAAQLNACVGDVR